MERHAHKQDHEHSYGHVHSPEERKATANRLSRAIGHLKAVKRMVEDGRDCSEVLIQLSAVKSAISSTERQILQSHIEHCLVEAVAHNDMEKVAELNHAIGFLFK